MATDTTSRPPQYRRASPASLAALCPAPVYCFMPASIVIAPGSINIDLILRTDVRRGPKTFRGRYAESQGGKGSNQAVAARRAGSGQTVHLVGVVGRDTWGEQALGALRAAGVHIDHVRIDGEANTGVVMEYLYADGEVTIGLAPGANDCMTVDDIEAARGQIEDAAVLLGQIEAPLDTVEHAFRLAQIAGVSTILDPSVVPVSKPEFDRLFEQILPCVDLISPNRSEAEALTGVGVTDDASALAATGQLLKHVSIAVLTRGSDGVIVARGHDHAFVRGHQVAAIDGGAAGDTFRGALALALAEAQSARSCPLSQLPFDWVVEAARFANAAAAVCVTRAGAYPAIPTREEIDALLQTAPSCESTA